MISKGYAVREREKLISPVFPTTFTMSGGPDLAYKFWQGDKSMLGNKIVNQPCIRHWDIELTGDKKHLSFFNMFVADSISGDGVFGYSRKEVISHFYEFFIEYLHLDPSRFYASYFGGGNIQGTNFEPDEEMREIWLSLGIPASRIIPLGGIHGMEAFVANTVEPVGGPRAELFYDLREDRTEVKSAEEFLTLDKEGKILEFCTHVLYNLEVRIEENEKGPLFSFQKMDKKAIAVGFGPQRILTILEKVNHVGDISILTLLRHCLGPVPKNLYREEVIVADHIRGLVMLINDGVLELHGEKNRSRRTIFNRYFRHFAENFSKLPIEDRSDALYRLTNETIELFSLLFPEFIKRKKFIQEKIIQLYADFEKTKEIMNETDLKNFLEKSGVEYHFIDRPETESVKEIASKTGLKLSQIVKSLVLKDPEGDKYLAVVRGDSQLDFEKFKKTIGVKKIVFVSSEEATKYSGYLTGATPPVFHRIPLKVVVDKKVLEQKTVFGGGGSRTKLVELNTNDIIKLNNALVGDITRSG